ncbi:MAG: response regulator transcription factor [Candidatus Omnitrophica bacterium]|nr:response regulator transcription factor [Candidatus Omnitrophota bacterium]
MTRPKILIVEDDKNIFKLLKYNLEKEGFDCQVSITGEGALELLDTEPVDLIILDIMLPKMDGLQVCKLIKQDKSLVSIPIIMLTAKGEEIDRIVGFELGVDDYVVKPFSPRELVLRVKAILNRGKKPVESKEILSIDKLIVDTSRYRVSVDEKDVALTRMEFKLLVALMQRKGRVLSRDDLLEEVWGMSTDVTTRTVDTHIKKLRQKLKKMGRLIETVRGIGYRFNYEQ